MNHKIVREICLAIVARLRRKQQHLPPKMGRINHVGTASGGHAMMAYDTLKLGEFRDANRFIRGRCRRLGGGGVDL